MKSHAERCIDIFNKLGFVDESGALEVDNLMAHILDCVAAVKYAQTLSEEQDEGDDEDKNDDDEEEESELDKKELHLSQNKVLSSAVTAMLIGDECIWNENTNPPLESLKWAFPDDRKYVDGRGWLPLHWTIALIEDEDSSAARYMMFEEDDVLNLIHIYREDLNTHHLDPSECEGYTPAHFFGMKANPQMSFVYHIETYDSTAFNVLSHHTDEEPPNESYATSIFHLVAEYSESPAFLKYLMQYDDTASDEACKTTSAVADSFQDTPLNIACARARKFYDEYGTLPYMCNIISQFLQIECNQEVLEGTPAGDLIRDCTDYAFLIVDCFLMELQKLQQVIEGGEIPLEEGYDGDRAMNVISTLLRINPEIASYRPEGGNQLIHIAATFVGDFGAALVGILLEYNPDCASAPSHVGDLPIQTATYFSTAAVMELLHEAYPEGTMVKAPSDNAESLLHVAVDIEHDDDHEVATNRTSVAEKVHFLCLRVPALVRERDNRGFLPLHLALMNSRGDESVNLGILSALCDADEHTVGERISIEDGAQNEEYRKRYTGKLPLHVMIMCNHEHLHDGASGNADVFRYLLALFPMAVLLGDAEGLTPIDIAEKYGVDPYFQRLMHKSMGFPSAKMKDLNYAARRDALLLAHPKPEQTAPGVLAEKQTLLSKLRAENKDLLRSVISFL